MFAHLYQVDPRNRNGDGDIVTFRSGDHSSEYVEHANRLSVGAVDDDDAVLRIDTDVVCRRVVDALRGAKDGVVGGNVRRMEGKNETAPCDRKPFV